MVYGLMGDFCVWPGLPLGLGDGGWLGNKGILDFAGGTVVHINAGHRGFGRMFGLGQTERYPTTPCPRTASCSPSWARPCCGSAGLALTRGASWPRTVSREWPWRSPRLPPRQLGLDVRRMGDPWQTQWFRHRLGRRGGLGCDHPGIRRGWPDGRFGHWRDGRRTVFRGGGSFKTRAWVRRLS